VKKVYLGYFSGLCGCVAAGGEGLSEGYLEHPVLHFLFAEGRVGF